MYRVVICVIFYFLYGLHFSHGSENSKRLLNIAASMEIGSNIANMMRTIQNITGPSLRSKNSALEILLEKLRSTFIHPIDGNKNCPLCGKKISLPGQAPASNGLDVWTAASSLIRYLANVFASNTDQQPIEQHDYGIKNKPSLLEKIAAGGIKGPVHIYGRHKSNED